MFFFIEAWLIYSIVLASGVQRSDSSLYRLHSFYSDCKILAVTAMCFEGPGYIYFVEFLYVCFSLNIVFVIPRFLIQNVI